jgi:hypothetical protein
MPGASSPHPQWALRVGPEGGLAYFHTFQFRDSELRDLSIVNENNNVAAINKLQAFVNEVEAQSGNQISAEGATALIATAQQVIDLLTG